MTSRNINMPGFLAEESLRPSQRHFVTRALAGSSQTDLLTPQVLTPPTRRGCWCSEPDVRRVCNSAGVCKNVAVCLQYVCPGGNDIDDPGDFFGGD
jgi:hypothetical protein